MRTGSAVAPTDFAGTHQTRRWSALSGFSARWNMATAAILVGLLPTWAFAGDRTPNWRLNARVVAVGLPDVAGVREVGRFHVGGPIPGNPEFLMATREGRVLDPLRVLVAVGSNFGAPPGDPVFEVGTILSIDPRAGKSAGTIIVPQDLTGKDADARVQLYTAQSERFLNRRYNAGARTARHAAASGPRYISINNAFGRPWIANAPGGINGEGSVTVVDPDGAPLANAPSREAGGVFAGRHTDRENTPKAQPSGWLGKLMNYQASGQLTSGGMQTGALGTAFLGPSPDGSGFAVFAAVTADGSVVQIHVQDGVDGLAGPGTVSTGLGTVSTGHGIGDDPGVIGVAFKWNPDRALYIADPGRDRLVLLELEDDRRHFTVARTRTISLPEFDRPVDVAAAIPEIANPQFSSHTTLAGGSDLFVANRGDGSLLRLSQDGRLLARATIEIPGLGPLGPDRLRAIATSADAQHIWITIGGEVPGFPGHEGALVEVGVFDEHGAAAAMQGTQGAAADANLAARGKKSFQTDFTPRMGLGPLFNATSCVACHPGPGGASIDENHFAGRIAHMDPGSGRTVPIDHPNSPVARRHALRDGVRIVSAAMPSQANVISLRMPLALYGIAGIDEIPDRVIEAQAVSKGDGIKGRAHHVVDGQGASRVGRYGWKADIATLEDMVANAFANELGITSATVSREAGSQPIEDDTAQIEAVAFYLRTLRLPDGAKP
ncbi:di-heme oxidoredictase family protein [Mesorhizobium sp. M6A.T.Cr.TU.016.01.1.1]|uniref:di-heme oxidoredictase family protein n=2 Tax=unclassified Mesorhizobium TaxID=325217 RepID=UPI001FDFEAAA|nr:di-heme oxidoredictase family protein [Mesorhizobium sp. M6A.T.Cr.TU.016.01.1.1]